MPAIATAIGLEAAYRTLRLDFLDRAQAYGCCLAFVVGYNWHRVSRVKIAQRRDANNHRYLVVLNPRPARQTWPVLAFWAVLAGFLGFLLGWFI